MRKIQDSFKITHKEIVLDSFMERYHFEEKDRTLLDAACRILTELIEAKVVILLKKEQAVCAVTLGKRYDELLNLTVDARHLLLSYSLECFSLEFLSLVYEKINEAVFFEMGKWLSEYHFLGDDNIEELETCLPLFDHLPVSWEKGMLHPLNSVVFMAGYKDRKEESGCSNCERCKNVTCSFRKMVKAENKPAQNANTKTMRMQVYSYGISQILGDGKQ